MADQVHHVVRTAEGAGRSPHWPAVRAAHLKKYPTCASCGEATDLNVHHVRPFHLHPDLELEESNLITLCEYHDCHLMRGHLGDWKSWNEDVRADAEAQLVKVLHRPYPPKEKAHA